MWKSGCKMFSVVAMGNSFLETIFSLVHPKLCTGNYKEEGDEDSPEDTFWDWKEVLGSAAPPETLERPVQHIQTTASSRTGFSFLPTTFFLRMVKLCKLGNGFSLFLNTLFFKFEGCQNILF